MSVIVLSGINLFEGGPLSIYTDCLECIIEKELYKGNEIIAFVHNKGLFQKYSRYIKFVELPKSRKKYIYRLYYEYIYFYFFSRKKNIDCWISLHDITPNVRARRLYTYCHNPTPFMENPRSIRKFSMNIYMMARLYKYIYRINIHKNDAIIVQQDWLRERFLALYPVKEVIVAIPKMPESQNELKEEVNVSRLRKKKTFVYASYPRAFKNFEIICEAAKILEKERLDFHIILTISGCENRYSKNLFEKYRDIKNIEWRGLQPREKVFEIYNDSDCMIFPSKLETWGLPISEYKKSGKTMLVADLPYAHETVGNYERVCFFDPEDAVGLANRMKAFLEEKLTYDRNVMAEIAKPYADNWGELFDLMGVTREK